MKRDGGKQQKMTFLTLEELMPEKHFLRDLERCVDFSFIYDIVEPLYARVGRPSIDPVLLVKMLLLGYLYGIPSERKLEQEVWVNIAFRWFLGIDFDEPVPDHSTISQLRRRKFGGTTLFQDIFDEVVRKCMAAGLVSGKLLLTDSTHILANAAKEKREVIEVPDTPSEYVKKLDREALEAGLLDEPVTYPEKTKTVTKSTTDPESGLMNRPGKPNAFCYLNHQTSDAESGIITDVFVTPGNVNDCTPHTSRLETQIDKRDEGMSTPICGRTESLYLLREDRRAPGEYGSGAAWLSAPQSHDGSARYSRGDRTIPAMRFRVFPGMKRSGTTGSSLVFYEL